MASETHGVPALVRTEELPVTVQPTTTSPPAGISYSIGMSAAPSRVMRSVVDLLRRGVIPTRAGAFVWTELSASEHT